jgi:general secretion pathway protein B
MSYILEALKKSDQQRQRGATPTLPVGQVMVVAPKQHFSVYYGLLAAVLLCAGILIGWLRPWQPEQPAPATEPTAAKSAISLQTAPAPLPKPPEVAQKTTQELPVPNSTPAVQHTDEIDASQPNSLAPVRSVTHVPVVTASAPMSEKPVSHADATHEQNATVITELPLSIQQEIPVMTVQIHAYSNIPMNRSVCINFRTLHEGEYMAPGLRLEQITPDGMIFSYKGYRFQHGIR